MKNKSIYIRTLEHEYLTQGKFPNIAFTKDRKQAVKKEYSQKNVAFMAALASMVRKRTRYLNFCEEKCFITVEED